MPLDHRRAATKYAADLTQWQSLCPELMQVLVFLGRPGLAVTLQGRDLLELAQAVDDMQMATLELCAQLRDRSALGIQIKQQPILLRIPNRRSVPPGRVTGALRHGRDTHRAQCLRGAAVHLCIPPVKDQTLAYTDDTVGVNHHGLDRRQIRRRSTGRDRESKLISTHRTKSRISAPPGNPCDAPTRQIPLFNITTWNDLHLMASGTPPPTTTPIRQIIAFVTLRR